MTSSAPVSRNMALDVMRGLTVAAMILVNNPGSWSYLWGPLGHADWHGYTPTDLVFPFFLFITGSAMFFALRRFNYEPSKDALTKLARRVLIIFGIGVFLHAYPFSKSFEELRIMGVLQRIAIAYGVATLAVLYLSTRGVIIFTLMLLIGYWAILFFAGSGDPYSLEGNIVAPIDQLILGASHMWAGKGMPFDPEGILSTLPSIANVTGGYLATKYLASLSSDTEKVKKMLAYGACLIVIGHVWGFLFPINKSLWTSSYAVTTVGWGLFVLGALIYLCGTSIGKKMAEPFRIYGTNPLFIYALSWVWVATYWLFPITVGGEQKYMSGIIYDFLVGVVGNPYLASHSYALIHVLLFWAISWALDKKKIYIKI